MEILLTWLDVVIVAAIVSPEQAAIYAAASRFITSGTLVAQGLRLAIAPQLSAALARNQLAQASEIYRVATQWIILTSWPLYLAMAIFAPRILRVFGADYATGATALSILCVAMMLNLAAGNVGTVLLMGGKSQWVLADKTAALALNIAGNVVLTSRFGIIGAAIAWAATIALDSGLAIVQVRYGMKVAGSWRSIWLCGATALACFGLIPLLGRVLAGSSLVSMIASLVLATCCFVPVAWKMRERTGLTILVGSLRRRGGVEAFPAGCAA
jgi:O-antigen/teichoic acid export membrane protein